MRSTGEVSIHDAEKDVLRSAALGFDSIAALARILEMRQSVPMTARTEIHADGTFNDRTSIGGWAAVIAHSTSGRQEGTSIYEMELRAMVEAVKMAEGPTTVISDYEWLVQNAQRGTPQATCRPLWDELFSATAGKDVTFEWSRRSQSLGSRLAHQLARDAARGR